jgi:hypothetical protein
MTEFGRQGLVVLVRFHPRLSAFLIRCAGTDKERPFLLRLFTARTGVTH